MKKLIMIMVLLVVMIVPLTANAQSSYTQRWDQFFGTSISPRVLESNAATTDVLYGAYGLTASARVTIYGYQTTNPLSKYIIYGRFTGSNNYQGRAKYNASYPWTQIVVDQLYWWTKGTAYFDTK